MFGLTLLVVVSEELALIIVLTQNSALLQAGNTKVGFQGVLLVSLAGSLVTGTGHWRGTLASTNQEHQGS